MVAVVAKGIRDLRIQGATNIAYSGVDAVRDVIASSRSKSKKVLLAELFKARKLLFNARPNEHMLYNAVNFIINDLSSYEGVDYVKHSLEVIDSLRVKFDESKRLMIKAGAGLIRKGSTVFTHCHASSVMGVLKASRVGEVFCTESRPKFQGRLTANELIKAGIKTTMMVDSAVANFIKSADYVLIGCDVISSTYVINKIGSRMISLLCDKYDVPLYVCSLSYKFTPESFDGIATDVEERSTKEVWDAPPKGLRIRNPAFDVVDFECITGFVTEHGVLPPDSFVNLMRQRKDKII